MVTYRPSFKETANDETDTTDDNGMMEVDEEGPPVAGTKATGMVQLKPFRVVTSADGTIISSAATVHQRNTLSRQH